MIALSEENKNALHDLGVETLYLFGSRAQGAEGPLSDYDFAALMSKDSEKRGGKTYDAIYDILSPLCPRTLENDVIDIVFLRDASLELKMHIVRYGKFSLTGICPPGQNLRKKQRFFTATFVQF